jgi:hypothetical protein
MDVQAAATDATRTALVTAIAPPFAISFNRPNFFNITCIYLLIRLRVLLVPAGRPGSGRILHSPADRRAMKAQS